MQCVIIGCHHRSDQTSRIITKLGVLHCLLCYISNSSYIILSHAISVTIHCVWCHVKSYQLHTKLSSTIEQYLVKDEVLLVTLDCVLLHINYISYITYCIVSYPIILVALHIVLCHTQLCYLQCILYCAIPYSIVIHCF